MTERKQAEEELLKSEEWFRAVVQNASDVITVIDTEATIRYVSPAVERVLGYRPAEMVGNSAFDYVHPEDLEEALGIFATVVSIPGVHAPLEFRVPHKDGSWRYLEHVVNNLLDDPSVRGIVVNQRDISERKKAEATLRESEERFRATFEQAAVGMAHNAPDGRWLRANQRICDIVGYTREELLGLTFQDITHPDDLDADLEHAKRLLAGEIQTYSMEKRYVKKDGSIVWINLTVSLVRSPSGEPKYFIAVIEDITKRKRVEEALRYQLDLTKTITANAADSLFLWDAEGRVTFMNPAAERTFGWSQEELLGEVLHERMHHHYPDGRPYPISECPLVRVFESGWTPRDHEDVFLRKDGTPVEVSCSLAPIVVDGEITGAALVVRDITERKRAEEARSRLATIVESSDDAIIGKTLEGIITSWNRGAQNIYGYSPVEVVGKPITILVPPDRPHEIPNILEKVRRGEPIDHFETVRVKKDGGRIYVSVTISPIRDSAGNIVGASTIARDITERKRTEEEIKTRARQQAAIAELGLQALAETDLSVLMDEAVALVARTLDVEYSKVLELLPDSDALLLRSGVGWKEGLVGNATVGTNLNSQVGYTLLSGEPVIVENLRSEGRFSGPPLLHEHGVVSGMSVIIHGRDELFGVLGAHTKSRRTFTEDDVNFLQAVANVLAMAVERQGAEQELREIRAVERRRIARDLHDEALQDLAYALQEMRNTRAKSKAPELKGELDREIHTLKRAVLGLRAAIYDLRLEGDGERTFVEMLESLAELNRQSSPERQIELSVQEGFVPPLAKAKQVELLRIVQEALANVRRHSGARRVRVAVGASTGKLWAEVEDDGHGFDPSKAPAGMGIRGMRERARALGGDLKIGSEPGKGAKVRFEIAPETDGKEPEEETHILLVEDHTSFRQAAAFVFEREPGFAVVGQAGSLAEARRMLDGVDVAIIDLRLPDGYGGELIKELRAVSPQAQALVLTASVDRAEMARAVESGAAGILHKSADMDEVVNAVRRLQAGETLLPLQEVMELMRFADSRREREHEARQAIAQLTPREKEVLQALAEGLDGEEIAERLRISPKTERNHVASILAKLGVHSRLQALVFALRHGVVDVR